MLTLDLLRNLELSSRPLFQRLVARGFLAANYAASGVDIVCEGWEHILSTPRAILAMNHTDRYNYFPFQYKLYRRFHRFTTTWVKGKYLRRALLRWFLLAANNIPVPSKGYLISQDYFNVFGSVPSREVYFALRQWVEGRWGEEDCRRRLGDMVYARIVKTRRHVLGLDYNPGEMGYGEFIVFLYERMMDAFIRLNGQALEKGLYVMVFPEGTRSVSLQRGHIGIAQLALYFRVPIIPIGCSGSHRVYPGDFPLARRGRVVYRIGVPITYEEMFPYRIEGDFRPFSRESEERYRDRFQGLVDMVMGKIALLLDEEHLVGGGRECVGVERFL